MLAIVQSEDVVKLSQRLLEQGFRLTQMNATGGFLAAGSAVLLIGVEDERLPALLVTIETTCQTRTHFINATPWPGAVGLPPVATIAPVEVLVGGAVVFGLPVQRFLRLTGGPAPLAAESAAAITAAADAAVATAHTAASEGMTTMNPATDPATTQPPAQPLPRPARNSVTKLVVAIVHSDDAGAVVDALLAAGQRLTRLNTAGGFFRRGNATLLIGVEAQRLEEVLALIQANCRLRTEANPPHEGMPMYGATVFVLDASHFVRF